MIVTKTAHIPVEVALNTLVKGAGFYLPSNGKIHVLMVDGPSSGSDPLPAFNLEDLASAALVGGTMVVKFDLTLTVADPA